MFTTLAEAEQVFAKARNKSQGKPVGNNTRLARNRDGGLCLILHQTAVVVYRPDGKIVLNSGGWKTVTTKERINNFTPRGICVSQHKMVWYLHVADKKFIFEDLCVVDPENWTATDLEGNELADISRQV